MTPAQEKIIVDALETFGTERQVTKCIEECGELITALAKYREGCATIEDVWDELADVGIMLRQMRRVFGQAGVECRTVQKMEKLASLIEQEKGEGSHA